MDRKKIKAEAKKMLKGNLWEILKPMLVVAAIYFVVGLITGVSSYSSMTGGFNVSMEVSNGNSGLNLLASILEIAALPISFGVLVYEVKFVRKQEYNLKDIFRYYSKFWPIFCLSFLVGLFSTLWALLLFIPGIIAAISYSQSFLIMIDGEEDPMDCIKKSKAMMKGYKWDYFVFQLSFILWHLLGMITFGLAYIYVGPFIQVADILYYEKLKEVHPAKKEAN